MKVTQAELKTILELHLKWLDKEGGSRANLSWANLSWANLEGANLSWANLEGANLEGANLSEANLSWANLSWAHLSEANLAGANLSWANLSEANLEGANLSWANLSWPNLEGANLSEANLDCSCLPLWCGSKGMKVSLKFIFQLLAHVSVLECTDEPKEYAKIRDLILPYAKKSHKAKELGLLEGK